MLFKRIKNRTFKRFDHLKWLDTYNLRNIYIILLIGQKQIHLHSLLNQNKNDLNDSPFGMDSDYSILNHLYRNKKKRYITKLKITN